MAKLERRGGAGSPAWLWTQPLVSVGNRNGKYPVHEGCVSRADVGDGDPARTPVGIEHDLGVLRKTNVRFPREHP